MCLRSALVLVATALAWAVTANAAPFALGRATHVSFESADVRGGSPVRVDRAGSDAAIAPLVSGALVIDATFDSSVTNDPNAAVIEAAINAAIAVYQALLDDPITVSILFRYSTTYANGTTTLPSGALSVSEGAAYVLPWSTYIGALAADATSANDASANASLPGSALTTNVVPSSADGRAIGLNTPPAMFANGTVATGGPYDGIVTINASKAFAFTRPPTVSTYDAQRATEHEIDEVLGLGSFLGTGSPDVRPQDLFSWSSAGVRNITTSGSRYFSVDGGTTDVVGFNQDPSGDRGDWMSAGCPQVNPYVQNAFSCMDQTADVTATSPEGINLDVIGYDLVGSSTTTTTSTPTTSTTSATTTSTTPASSTTTTTHASSTTSTTGTFTTTTHTSTTSTTRPSTTTIVVSTTTSTTLLTVLSACPDAAQATAIEMAIETQCHCASAPDHGSYVRCATQVAKSALKSGTLSKQCKLAAVDCAGRSTCGKHGFVTCCRTTPRGRTTCSIKRDAAHCKAPKQGTACAGQRASCCDACGPDGCAAPTAAP